MKFIKENWISLLLIFISLGYFYFNHERIETADKKINKLESENYVLKSNIVIKEKEVKESKKITKKIQLEKDDIAKAWNLDKVNNKKIVNSLNKRLSIKRKPVIIYKDAEIKESDSQGRLFRFGTDVYFSLLEYRKKDLKERAKTKKTITTLESVITDLKTVNIKSEEIITFKDIKIKSLKKKNKKTIIIAVAVVVSIFVFK